jgi:hypothetical protein
MFFISDFLFNCGRATFKVLLIVMSWVNPCFGKQYREIYTVSDDFSVMKDDESGFYLLCSKKLKVLDKLSYHSKDSLFNFEIDPLFIRERFYLRVKFDLRNKYESDDVNSILDAKKIVAIDVSNKAVWWSFLYELNFNRIDYHHYENVNDTLSNEETHFGYRFDYEVRYKRDIQLTFIVASGALEKINPLYLEDYLAITEDNGARYTWKHGRWRRVL